MTAPLRSLSALRHQLASAAPRMRPQQRRWAQVHDVRFLATTRPRLSVLEKYRDKLDRKAREEGHESVDELKKAYADQIREQRLRDAEKSQSLEQNGQQQQNGAPAAPGSHAHDGAPTPTPDGHTPRKAPRTPAADPSSDSPTGTGKMGPKPLSEILDLPKARTLPAKELTAIWRLRHAASPTSLCATVPHATYESMEDLARTCPQFVLPVPRPDHGGAELHFLQWTFDAATSTSTVLFTQLAEFKARGEWAQPHTTVTHHLDLAADKGLVMMQGQVVEGRGASVEDARWLVMCLQRFYGGWDGESAEGARGERAVARRKLLEGFARGGEGFSVEELLEEAERMG